MGADGNPVFGICAIPHLGPEVFHYAGMATHRDREEAGAGTNARPRDILAENLKTLMAASSKLSTFPDIIRASNGKISNGTLDRIRRKESATGVDSLEPLAEVFGMQAWQLLVPGLSAVEGPDGRLIVRGLPDWPLGLVDRQRYYVLGAPDQAYVQGKMVAAIEELELHLHPAGNDDEKLAAGALLKPKGVAPGRRRTGTR